MLAAFGTALPGSVVTLVAVVFGKTPDAKDIGVGVALGGPLALSTPAYAVVGAMFLIDRTRGQEVSERVLQPHAQPLQLAARPAVRRAAIWIEPAGVGVGGVVAVRGHAASAGAQVIVGG